MLAAFSCRHIRMSRKASALGELLLASPRHHKNEIWPHGRQQNGASNPTKVFELRYLVGANLIKS